MFKYIIFIRNCKFLYLIEFYILFLNAYGTVNKNALFYFFMRNDFTDFDGTSILHGVNKATLI